MNDRIKESIFDETVVRDIVGEDAAINQYYRDLVEGLNLNELPLISINTIEKRTYIVECSNHYYLVFDYYLMEVLDSLNQFLMRDDLADCFKPFCYKIISEECYISCNYSTAVKFVLNYINDLDNMLFRYQIDKSIDHTSEYLFIQQAFLLAHEIYHFYVRKKQSREIESMTEKELFLQRIFLNIRKRKPELAPFIEDVVNDKRIIEECMCDSIAVVQAMDVSLKVRKLDIVETGVAIIMTLLGQYIISIIQDTVKYHGDMTYERMQNLFNFRLLHLKEMVLRYIRNFGSEEELERSYKVIDGIHNEWMKKVYRPTMFLLVECNSMLKEMQDSDQRISDQIKKTLRQIYKC